MDRFDDLQAALVDIRAATNSGLELLSEDEESTEHGRLADAIWETSEALRSLEILVEELRADCATTPPHLSYRDLCAIAEAVGTPEWAVVEYWPDSLDKLLGKGFSDGTRMR